MTKVYYNDDEDITMVTQKNIDDFYEILPIIRKSVGWTAEEFGRKSYLSRQVINHLESHRSKLSPLQYVGMRHALDEEIKENPEGTEMLKTLLEVFVDNPDKYDEDKKKEIKEKAALIAPAIAEDPSSRKRIVAQWAAIVGTALGGFPITSIVLAFAFDAWNKKEGK